MLPVIANLINFVILVSFLAYMLRKPASGMLKKRADRVLAQLNNAQEELEKANELKLLYEQKMEEITRERDEILNEAHSNAKETSRRLITEAEKEAEAIRQRAAANAAFEWERAETEMRSVILDASSVMAEKFVTKAFNKDTHDLLFTELIADLEAVSWID